MATYYMVEGREFVPGERKKALAYARQRANETGEPVAVTIEKGDVVRDPSGFVYDFHVNERKSVIVRPSRKMNPLRYPRLLNPRGRKRNCGPDGIERDKWIPAHAVRFNKDGSVSMMY